MTNCVFAEVIGSESSSSAVKDETELNVDYRIAIKTAHQYDKREGILDTTYKTEWSISVTKSVILSAACRTYKCMSCKSGHKADHRADCRH